MSYLKNITPRTLVVIGVLSIIFTAGLVYGATKVVNVSGWLWAADNNQGVGWIAIDCSIANNSGGSVCGQSNFGMKIDSSTDKVSGYIWSSNIGWLRFGGLSGCPKGNCDARIKASGSNYEMLGWARACSVYESGCSGALKDNIYRGGWDGWVSLNCANHNGCGSSNYKVKINTDGSIPNNAFAWGGDIIGAVSFGLGQMQCSVTPSRCNTDNTGVITTNALCKEETTLCSSGSICKNARCVKVTSADVNAVIKFGSDLVRAGDKTTVSWTFVSTPPENTDCRVVSATGNVITTNGGNSEIINVGEIKHTLYCSVNSGDEFEEDSKNLRSLPSVQES